MSEKTTTYRYPANGGELSTDTIKGKTTLWISRHHGINIEGPTQKIINLLREIADDLSKLDRRETRSPDNIVHEDMIEVER